MKIVGYMAATAAVVLAASVALAQARGGLLSQRRNPRAGAAGGGAAENAGGGSGAGAPDLEAAEKNVNSPKLTISDVSIKEVLQYVYAPLIKKSVIISPNIPDTKISFLTEQNQQLSAEAKIVALEALFEMNGVHIQPYGLDDSFVRAVPRNEVATDMPTILKPDMSVNESLNVVSKLIQFKNISASEEAKPVFEGIKTKTGQLMVLERTNSILVTDASQNVNRMSEIAEMIDIATPIDENVFYYQVEHASASEIKTALETIVQESQKELEKNGKAQQNAANNNRTGAVQPTTLLRRPGMRDQQPEPPASVETIIASMSEADRGLIRGKVVILADDRSNKLVIITKPSNMKFFEQLIKQLDVATTPEVEVEVIRLKYADAEDVADMINDLIGNSVSSKGNSKGNQNQNTRTGGTVNGTRGAVSPTAMNAPRATAGQKSGDSRTGELSKDNVTVLADKRINGIVVMARKQDMASVREIVERMDVKLSQVLIETVIIEVGLGDDIKTGMDWIQKGRKQSPVQAKDSLGQNLFYKTRTTTITGEDGSSRTTTSVLPDLVPAGYSDSYSYESGGSTYSISDAASDVAAMTTEIVRDGLNYFTGGAIGMGGGASGGAAAYAMANTAAIATSNVLATAFGGSFNFVFDSDALGLTAILNASQSDSRSKYIASPIIMTLDNKEAIINATEMMYLLKGFTSSGNSYSTIAVPDYEQKELGIKIKVTPKINPNGTVMMSVEEEYTQQGTYQTIQYATGNSNSGTGGGSVLQNVDVPTTITRTMSADVLLENNQTVVFGGLTKTYTSESETGIPFLKDIPWIGKWLFSKVQNTETRTELMVFMTPYVLTDAEQAQAEALRRKNTMSDSRPWEDNGWSLSPLADPVGKKEMLRRLKDEAKKQDEERKTRLAIEKWKMERAKALEEMDEDERKFWIETHRDELGEEEQEKFDKEVADREDLKKLVKSIRAERLEKANAKMKENAAALAAEEEEPQGAKPEPAAKGALEGQGAVGGAADSPRGAEASKGAEGATPAQAPLNYERQPDALKPEPGAGEANTAQVPRNHARQPDALKPEPASAGAEATDAGAEATSAGAEATDAGAEATGAALWAKPEPAAGEAEAKKEEGE